MTNRLKYLTLTAAIAAVTLLPTHADASKADTGCITHWNYTQAEVNMTKADVEHIAFEGIEGGTLSQSNTTLVKFYNACYTNHHAEVTYKLGPNGQLWKLDTKAWLDGEIWS